MKICTVLFFIFEIVVAFGVPDRGVAGPPFDPEILVGVNYFAGWWREPPNKWHGKGWSSEEPDWRCVYPERKPLLGDYNEQATMDREINVAAEHHVHFFSILWYYGAPDTKEAVLADRLNRGVKCFMMSPHADRMCFMIEYCNHAQYAAHTEKHWQDCIAVWSQAMRHPSYLRVGGRLVFKIHDARGFLTQNQDDPVQAEARLKALRKAVHDAGLGDMIIGGGIMSRTQVPASSPLLRLFDFTATYMSIPPVALRDQDLPYTVLAAEAREARTLHARDPLPWIPYLAAGWNPRPWTHPKADENHRRFFAFPSREEWADELRALRADFQRFPELGFPLPDHRRQKACMIYAWNEFGEGGMVAPTQGAGVMKLEVIRDFINSIDHP